MDRPRSEVALPRAEGRCRGLPSLVERDGSCDPFLAAPKFGVGTLVFRLTARTRTASDVL